MINIEEMANTINGIPLASLEKLISYLEKSLIRKVRWKRGLCGVVYMYCRDNQLPGLVLCSLIDYWPSLFSGNFPVGGAKEFYREVMNKTLWENPRRIALTRWYIETLKEIIKFKEIKLKELSES